MQGNGEKAAAVRPAAAEAVRALSAASTYLFKLPPSDQTYSGGSTITVRVLAPDLTTADYTLRVFAEGAQSSSYSATADDELDAQDGDPANHKIYQFLNVPLPTVVGAVYLKFYLTVEDTPRKIRLIYVS